MSFHGRGPNGAARQEAALKQEGVEVGRGHLGERTVDFAEYGWFPDRLPSEESEDEE
jgi:methylated-DNA-protein-cysteine methyltransferase-like protein